MGRTKIGLLVGAIAMVITIIFGFISSLALWGGLVLAVIGGVIAGIYAGRDTFFAGRSGGAGLIAGIFVGGLLLIGQIIGGAIFATTSPIIAPQTIADVRPTLAAAATATVAAGGTAPNVDGQLRGALAGVGAIGGCLTGFIGFALALVAGAAAGAIAGRQNKPLATTTTSPPAMR